MNIEKRRGAYLRDRYSAIVKYYTIWLFSKVPFILVAIIFIQKIVLPSNLLTCTFAYNAGKLHENIRVSRVSWNNEKRKIKIVEDKGRLNLYYQTFWIYNSFLEEPINHGVHQNRLKILNSLSFRNLEISRSGIITIVFLSPDDNTYLFKRKAIGAVIRTYLKEREIS